MSIIKHVTLQKIVAHDFRYDPRNMRHMVVFIYQGRIQHSTSVYHNSINKTDCFKQEQLVLNKNNLFF